ncbi:MAG: DUF4265 domain-containing protein [Terracidiphilus sp.]
MADRDPLADDFCPPILDEIWFRIERDTDGYQENRTREAVLAERITGGYVIASVPFFIKNVSVGDMVEVSEGKTLAFKRVVRRGGHNTYRLLVQADSGREIDETVVELLDLGLTVEPVTSRLIAVDVPPSVDQRQIDSYFVKESELGRWKMHEGCLSGFTSKVSA